MAEAEYKFPDEEVTNPKYAYLDIPDHEIIFVRTLDDFKWYETYLPGPRDYFTEEGWNVKKWSHSIPNK